MAKKPKIPNEEEMFEMGMSAAKSAARKLRFVWIVAVAGILGLVVTILSVAGLLIAALVKYVLS
jgi:hypothetical protein